MVRSQRDERTITKHSNVLKAMVLFVDTDAATRVCKSVGERAKLAGGVNEERDAQRE